MNKSFLKWAGGKYRVLPILLPIINEHIDPDIKDQTFIEPFMGSGTVFLNIEGINNFILNDSNQRLMEVFWSLTGNNSDDFIKKTEKCFKQKYNTKDEFKKIVEKYNKKSKIKHPELFIYLNKHCFNGLMRFNQSGFFNTPFGNYENPRCPTDEMNFFAKKCLENTVVLMNKDFETIMESANFGDIVYCDPPYVDLGKSVSFRQYGNQVFDMECQKKLVELAKKASLRGATVIISNHYNDVTKNLYKDCAEYHVFEVRRSISSKGAKREMAEEIIAVYKC